MMLTELPSHRLILNQLVFHVRLGCSDLERERPQKIHMMVELRFQRQPQGFGSDQLEETLCYAELYKVIKEKISGQQFHLIEKIASETYLAIQEFSSSRASIAVRIFKVAPPVPGLEFGVTYEAGDFRI